MPHLLIQNGNGNPQEHALTGDVTTIGRSADNGIIIDHESVSGRHAEIRRKGDRYSVRELGSSNGTTVNGTPIQRLEVKSGDVIRFGPVEARLVAEDPVAEPPKEAGKPDGRVLVGEIFNGLCDKIEETGRGFWQETKRTARLATLKAKIAKLETIDLNAAHYALGKKCYELGLHKEQFASEFAEIREQEASIERENHEVFSGDPNATLGKLSLAWNLISKKFGAKCLAWKIKRKLIVVGKAVPEPSRNDALNTEWIAIRSVEEHAKQLQDELAGPLLLPRPHWPLAWGLAASVLFGSIYLIAFPFKQPYRAVNSGVKEIGPQSQTQNSAGAAFVFSNGEKAYGGEVFSKFTYLDEGKEQELRDLVFIGQQSGLFVLFAANSLDSQRKRFVSATDSSGLHIVRNHNRQLQAAATKWFATFGKDSPSDTLNRLSDAAAFWHNPNVDESKSFDLLWKDFIAASSAMAQTFKPRTLYIRRRIKHGVYEANLVDGNGNPMSEKHLLLRSRSEFGRSGLTKMAVECVGTEAVQMTDGFAADVYILEERTGDFKDWLEHLNQWQTTSGALRRYLQAQPASSSRIGEVIAKCCAFAESSGERLCIVEIPDVSVAAQESAKLYSLLQTAVDNEIQTVGYMPDASTYGMKPSQNGNGNPSNGNGSGNGHPYSANRNGEHWNCTDGQKGLILRVVEEHKLDKNEIEGIAQQLFGIGVRELDKMQCSQLIEELLEKTGKSKGRRRWSPRPQPARP